MSVCPVCLVPVSTKQYVWRTFKRWKNMKMIDLLMTSATWVNIKYFSLLHFFCLLSLLFMIGILGSTTIISEFRDRRVRQAKQRTGPRGFLLNEKTHLLASHDQPEMEFQPEDVFEEEYLSLYDCSLEIYQQTKNDCQWFYVWYKTMTVKQ